MSYDMFVQRFEQGDAAPMPGDAFRAVFAPRADRREPQHGYWHISADDGGTADIYATEEGPPPQHHQRRATRREHQTKTGPEGPEFSLICAGSVPADLAGGISPGRTCCWWS
ncbi:hypothetical protein AB0B10_03430 [Micromonospora arborensis]|uniref:hypothetical protein n=1 Tax=Micromonospora arborensis TaxID=2116518 RepID=UPI0033D32CC5